ncbi:dihydrolipoamide acetyltransferase family protein [Candidatus Hepatoplasma crinochetorum]|uniref:dihydrolipoamide acetyltransferase family protein n=1 Tax=Candidatus Hepatoplasma crinochetorum TaxID=295596 RepID=UPI0030869E26|nr:MAG: dihydrolipoyllysine-residue acetyltransferase component of pyruvate dehydrogenase complex [Candidatus Hepatoplasma crinochetorum]
MAKAIKAPKMGNTVESIILGDIKVKVGDTIKNGDVLFEYETDKSTTEFKSEDSGEVLKIFYEAGDEVKVLEPVILIGKKGEDISEWEKISKNEEISPKKEENTSEIKQEQQSSNDTSIKEKTQGQQNQNENQKIFVSPRAKMIAKSLDINLKNVDHISGVNNRIMEKDIIQSYYEDIDKKNIGQEFFHTKFTPVRKAIARSMEDSLQHGAQLTLMAPFDATNLLNVRSIIKAKVEEKEVGIENSSINDLIVYVLARTLIEFPHINSLIGPDYYDAYNVAHVAIAVDAPKGLFVPVVRNASEISLNELTRISKELIIKTKEGKLSPKDQIGGTFTISNLGLSGVTAFTPILNPPQAALLGVGSPIKRLKMVKNGIVEYSEIILSLTMDHRPFDGAKGAEFLKELKQRLENVSYDQFK